MTGAWFAGELAAVAAGSGLAILVIRRWLRHLLPADVTAAERRYAVGRAAWISGTSAMIPAAVGLFLMWHWPGTAVADFIVAGLGFTLAGWFYSQRVRGSAGRERTPTGRD